MPIIRTLIKFPEQTFNCKALVLLADLQVVMTATVHKDKSGYFFYWVR